jgi:chromosome segregation ATPase
MHKELEFKPAEKTNQMHSLEFHEETEQMKTHYENLLGQISSLQTVLCDLRLEMIENENELVSLKKSFEQKLVDRVEHCKQEVVDFQIKYDNACRDNANLKSEYERTIKDLVSNDSNLNAVIVELTNELNNRDNELNSLKKKMLDYESEINTILSTNQHKADLINEWIEKYNQQENELNQADLKSKSLCEEVSCLNAKLLELTNEKDETLRMIEEFSSKVTDMSQEKNALIKEIEMKEKEIMELRGI